MLRTEEEARKCWRPFARSPQVGMAEPSPSANRTPGGKVDEGARCIASECMAWRFLDYVDDDDAVWRVKSISMTHRTAQRLERAEDRRGFCGLAHEIPR